MCDESAAAVERPSVDGDGWSRRVALGRSQVSQAEEIARCLRIHPRVQQQGIAGGPEDRLKFATALPALTPFRGLPFTAFAAVLDWDHKLPSEMVMLRLFAFHSPDSLAAITVALEARSRAIETSDRFPEFDVADFAGLADAGADEAYEVDIKLDGTLDSVRHVSPWRREIADALGQTACEIVRQSSELRQIVLQQLARSSLMPHLQALQWVPPFEAEHTRWVIDVWYLVERRGRDVLARSFLVDPEEKRVVSTREILLRVT